MPFRQLKVLWDADRGEEIPAPGCLIPTAPSAIPFLKGKVVLLKKHLKISGSACCCVGLEQPG